MSAQPENPNPVVFQPLDINKLKAERSVARGAGAEDEDAERDPIDVSLRPVRGRLSDVCVACGARVQVLEVYEMVRNINDPEHPLTLEQLKVVEPSLIRVDDAKSTVDMLFTPTIPHCSMATLIGLCLRVKLLRSLPPRFKIFISINPGSHASEAAINKQLNDKERVAAALENERLLSTVAQCLKPK